MKKTTVVFVCTLMLADLCALEWPAAIVKPLRFFGQRTENRIERGIILDKVDTVRAAGNGTLLYTMEKNRNMTGFPSTLGNAVVIAHDDGILSVYGNLDSIGRIAGHLQIETGAILGGGGTSGWTGSGNLILQVIDQERKTLLNPLLVLPALPDSHAPSIRNVIAISSNNQTAVLGSAKIIKQGKYRIYADISDVIDSSSAPLGPFRISVLLNGSESASIPFEVLKEDASGKLYLNSPEYTAAQLYGDPERTFLGEITLNRGRADITIVARDVAGNERTALFGVQIE